MNGLPVLFNNLYFAKISKGDGPAGCADKEGVIVLVQDQYLPVENSVHMSFKRLQYFSDRTITVIIRGIYPKPQTESRQKPLLSDEKNSTFRHCLTS
jgi:hypothetical protein